MSADEDVTVRRVVSDMISDHLSLARAEAGELGWSPTLWARLQEAGFTTVCEYPITVEPALDAFATVLRVSGYHAVPVPLAEHNVASALLGAHRGILAGQRERANAATVVNIERTSMRIDRCAGGWRVTGTLRAVPWAGPAGMIVLFAGRDGGTVVGVVSAVEVTLSLPRRNLAGEPVADVSIAEPGVLLKPVPVAPEWAAALSDIAGALLITGSLRRVLDLTVRYSRDREQFGRPIGSFQAVAHHLAALASAVEQADAIVEAAVSALRSGDRLRESALAAKVCCARAANVGIRVGHQVHGAIGVTEEYELHHHTCRLMEWRDRGGTEHRAALEFGRGIVDRSAEGLWRLLTGTCAAKPVNSHA